MRQGRFDEAIPHLRRAVALDPNSTTARDHLGIAYLKTKQYPAALEQFEAEIRLDKDPFVGWSRVADVHYAQRDFRRAAQALEKAVSLRPEEPQLRFNLAMVHQHLARMPEAEQALSRCVELAPANHSARYSLGSLLHQMRRLDDAQRELERARALSPQTGDYHHGLGRLLLERKATADNLDRALRHLKQALELSATKPAELRYHLGVCLQRQEKWAQARKELRTAALAGTSLTTTVAVDDIGPLTPGITYQFWVTGHNSRGYGPESNHVTVTA